MGRRTVTRKAVFSVAQQLARRQETMQAEAQKAAEASRPMLHAAADAFGEARLLVEALLTEEA